ncbi:MAG: ribosome biogenesis GTPase YlqF, partial [Erysipelotrichaceae bacterium]|nr:ribosome biogenesis GTPase YlqF [Erysipelotrichaceae bacterium]
WYPGHMAKTKREISEKISLIDIVFEVIDARIPKSSKNQDIQEMIKNKPRVLIMTKVDLCDEDETLKWKQYYENLGYHVVMVDLLHDKNLNSILQITKEMAQEVNQKRKLKGLKPRRIRILVLGIPNVGKSTLINRLVGKKATNVGNKPGVTKNLEWIRINQELELLDTPGILWPKLEGENIALNLAAMTAIKEEILNKEEVAIYIVSKLLKNYSNRLIERYQLKKTDDVTEIFDEIATKIGAIRGSDVDYEKVYTVLLKDLREGYLGKVTFDSYEDREV